ncbi:MAG: hypothetical protein WA364_03350 [Candidatus Nitrosopolaris sp.]
MSSLKTTMMTNAVNLYYWKKYYCNKCGKEYPGCPLIRYENPNEELGEEVILIEKWVSI